MHKQPTDVEFHALMLSFQLKKPSSNTSARVRTQHFASLTLKRHSTPLNTQLLLKHLFEIGTNGKCWRLFKNWYTNSSNVIKLDHSYLNSFPVHCGVRQGSVLSLSYSVHHSLLKHLESSAQTLCMYGLDVGSSAHADDIRAASNFTHATHVQSNCINAFCSSNSFLLALSPPAPLMLQALLLIHNHKPNA